MSLTPDSLSPQEILLHYQSGLILLFYYLFTLFLCTANFILAHFYIIHTVNSDNTYTCKYIHVYIYFIVLKLLLLVFISSSSLQNFSSAHNQIKKVKTT